MKKIVLCYMVFVFGSVQMPAQNSIDKTGIDFQFMDRLVDAGVLDACEKMGIDFTRVFAPLAKRIDHPYRTYRWSTSNDGSPYPIIHARPPEEETGWTPWERWQLKNGEMAHTEWVQYPIKTPLKKNIIPWYVLHKSKDLTPRFSKKTANLEEKLLLARVDIASEWLGLDFKKTFLDDVPNEIQKKYYNFRWTVVSHVLAADGPVIYALPPMHKSDEWPWESWYTDGVTSHIHHVHYTKANELTVDGQWAEPEKAPQRPPEVYGHLWYWYNDLNMAPALVHANE